MYLSTWNTWVAVLIDLGVGDHVLPVWRRVGSSECKNNLILRRVVAREGKSISGSVQKLLAFFQAPKTAAGFAAGPRSQRRVRTICRCWIVESLLCNGTIISHCISSQYVRTYHDWSRNEKQHNMWEAFKHSKLINYNYWNAINFYYMLLSSFCNW